MQNHSSSDRSVGYLVLSMAQSVGHHHARRALSRQSLEEAFSEVGSIQEGRASYIGPTFNGAWSILWTFGFSRTWRFLRLRPRWAPGKKGSTLGSGISWSIRVASHSRESK